MKYRITILAFLIVSTANISAQDLDVIIPNNGTEIGGTLSKQDSNRELPLVILITGSGAQDRDETIFGFRPFKVIADSLKQAGISSFRYDDRGVRRSTGTFTEATLDDLVSDVDAITSFMSSEYGYEKFILLGHSQGGIVALKALESNSKISGLILMASPTIVMKEVINDQVSSLQALAGKTEEEIGRTLEFQEQVYAAVRDDTGWVEVRSAYGDLVKVELAKLPEVQRAYIVDVDAFIEAQYKQQVLPMNNPQIRSLLFFEPLGKFDEVKIPVLGIFGGKDTQVSPEQNKAPLDQACYNFGVTCRIRVFPEANHLFQKARTGLVNEYSTLPKEFVSGFTSEMISWIKDQTF